MPQTISLDGPHTWPEPVFRFASSTVQRLDGSTLYTNDLAIHNVGTVALNDTEESEVLPLGEADRC